MTTPAHRLQRLPRLRWHQLLLILLALTVIVVLRKHTAQMEDRSAPVAVHGAVGQRLQGRNFAIEVASVRVAQRLSARDPLAYPPRTLRLETAGVWLVVAARVESLEEPGLVGARLRTRDGLEYEALDGTRLRASNLDRVVVPGLPETGNYFFELPADRLQGAHLEFFWGGLVPKPLDSLLDVDLDIDVATAQRLLAAAKPELDPGR